MTVGDASRQPRRRIALSLPLLGLATAWGVREVFAMRGFEFGPGWEGVAIARELAKTGLYGNPFLVGHSGPTAVIAPLFPAWLALIIRVVGDNPAFVLTATFAAVFANALHAAALPAIAERLWGSRLAGLIAGVAAIFALRLMPQWDANFTAAGLVLFVAWAKLDTPWRAGWAGLGAGLLVLTNASSLLITVPWIAYLVLRERRLLRSAVWFAGVMAVVVLPWMVRNQVLLGTLSIKDNFGMTFYASNNDCASAGIASSIQSGCYNGLHPNKSSAELQLLNRLGEAGYDKVRTADTFRWISQHPGAFAKLTASRVAEFWFPPPGATGFSNELVWLVTLLSVPGLGLLLWRKVPGGWFLACLMLVYPLLYYAVVSDVRYRYPLLWVSLLCAGYGVELAFCRFNGWRKL